MFNILANLAKILMGKTQCNRFCFIPLGKQVVLGFLVSVKTLKNVLLKNIKKCLEINLRRKEYFAKHVVVCEML